MLLLFSLNSQTYSSATEHLFLQYMDCISAYNEVDKELGCVHRRWSLTDEEDHSTDAKEELNNRLELSMAEWFRVKPVSAIRDVEHVKGDNYGIPSMSRALPWPYHRFYINRSYGEELLKNRNIYSEG